MTLRITGWYAVLQVLLPGLAMGAAFVLASLLYQIGLPVTVSLLAGIAVAAIIALGRSLPPEDLGRAVAADERDTDRRSTLGDFAALHARLDACSRDDERFESRVRPDLRQLVAERLRQRHGVDWLADPQTAQTVAGPVLWTLLTAPSGTLRGSRAHIEAWVAELERM